MKIIGVFTLQFHSTVVLASATRLSNLFQKHAFRLFVISLPISDDLQESIRVIHFIKLQSKYTKYLLWWKSREALWALSSAPTPVWWKCWRPSSSAAKVEAICNRTQLRNSRKRPRIRMRVLLSLPLDGWLADEEYRVLVLFGFRGVDVSEGGAHGRFADDAEGHSGHEGLQDDGFALRRVQHFADFGAVLDHDFGVLLQDVEVEGGGEHSAPVAPFVACKGGHGFSESGKAHFLGTFVLRRRK